MLDDGGMSHEGLGLTRDSAGRLVVARRESPNDLLVLERYVGDSLEKDISYKGPASISANSSAYYNSFIGSDCMGRVYVVLNTSTPSYRLYRFSSDTGAVDEGYGTNGYVELPATSYHQLYGLHVAEDGTTFAFGELNDFGVVWKVEPNGSPDEDWGASGVLTTKDVGGTNYSRMRFQSFKQLDDGKILLGGRAKKISAGQDYDATLWRFNPNGEPDRSFGTNGSTVLSASTHSEGIEELLVTDDAIFAGITYRSTGSLIVTYVYVRKFDLSGAPVSGYFISPPGHGSNSISPLIKLAYLESDGRIAVGYESYGYFHLNTYDAGSASVQTSLETSFQKASGHSYQSIRGLTKDASGRLVILGQATFVDPHLNQAFVVIK